MLLIKRIMNCLRIRTRKKVAITVLQCCTPAGCVMRGYNNTHLEFFSGEIFFLKNFIMAWEAKSLFTSIIYF